MRIRPPKSTPLSGYVVVHPSADSCVCHLSQARHWALETQKVAELCLENTLGVVRNTAETDKLHSVLARAEAPLGTGRPSAGGHRERARKVAQEDGGRRSEST